jgi:hypothetical protein
MPRPKLLPRLWVIAEASCPQGNNPGSSRHLRGLKTAPGNRRPAMEWTGRQVANGGSRKPGFRFWRFGSGKKNPGQLDDLGTMTHGLPVPTGSRNVEITFAFSRAPAWAAAPVSARV